MKVKKLKYFLLSAALLFFAAALIIYPERYVDCCFKGFAMWAECVLPSLFPFMVITLILIKTGIAEKTSLPLKKFTGKFHLPPAAAVCFIMSILSGYPAGARAVTEFYDCGCLNKSDCKKLSVLCSTSGPLFILGSVGYKMFGDKGMGFKILFAHALSVIVISLILSLFSKKSESGNLRRAKIDENALYNSFYGAVIAVAVAGGFISFFCVAAQLLNDFNIFFPLEKLLCLFTDENSASAVCKGIIEATAGCRALSESGGKLALPFAGLLITFGGFSIIAQQLCYLLKAKVNAGYFIGVKFLQGVVCFLILLAFI